MAVLPMQRICICALKSERKQILELLQRLGVIEIQDVIEEDSVFHKMDVSVARSTLEKSVASAKDALAILETYVPEQKGKFAMFQGRSQVETDQYDTFSLKHDTAIRTSSRIVKLAKDITEHKAEIQKRNTQLETLATWMELDVPLSFEGTKNTTAFIGTLPGEWNQELIEEHLTDVLPIIVEVLSSSREQTNLFALCLKQKEDKLLEMLRGMGFSNPTMLTDKAPTEQKEAWEKQCVLLLKQIDSDEKEIKSYESAREDLKFLEDYDSMRDEKYEVLSHLLQSNRVFFMTGYVAQQDCSLIERELNERFHLALEFEEPSQEEDVPVVLKNNNFSSPLEGTVAAFSLPGKGETDPTFIMSLFYYMLFGLMLSDAAYGAIMVAVCGYILHKFKQTIEKPLKNMLSMFFYCGIFTVFWGVMFGSYFGDIVDVVSETFFGKKVTIPPIWFFPVKEPMRMLVFAMLLGIIHLYAGLAMKFYQCMKQRDIKALVYDVIFWYVLLTSSVFVLLSMEVFTNTLGLNFRISATVGQLSGIVAVISAAGITFTNGRESRNPFKRFLKGLYALYGITGYLSDVLSYSRLLALGLATGVICTVINKMAGMAAKGPIGIVLFILIFVMGHSLNIGINALGAYVHTNRLQYVEFFGKFYEGGGRSFRPFRVNTKYYKFKEKRNNE